MYREEKIGDDFLSDLGELYMNSVTLTDFEVYRCDLEDAMQEEFNIVRKRCII